jgi:hypothetical protein
MSKDLACAIRASCAVYRTTTLHRKDVARFIRYYTPGRRLEKALRAEFAAVSDEALGRYLRFLTSALVWMRAVEASQAAA